MSSRITRAAEVRCDKEGDHFASNLLKQRVEQLSFVDRRERRVRAAMDAAFEASPNILFLTKVTAWTRKAYWPKSFSHTLFLRNMPLLLVLCAVRGSHPGLGQALCAWWRGAGAERAYLVAPQQPARPPSPPPTGEYLATCDLCGWTGNEGELAFDKHGVQSGVSCSDCVQDLSGDEDSGAWIGLDEGRPRQRHRHRRHA